MSHTHPDLDDPPEPARPTLDDAIEVEAPGDATTTEMPRLDETAREEAVTRPLSPMAGPRRGRTVWVLLGALFAAALIGPFIFYFGFWRFEPTAQRHVPAATVLAVRVDARELYLWKPFREHVLPALAPPSEDATRPSFLARVRSLTGVDLQTDVRELVVATPDAQRWVVLAGGRFLGSTRRGPFVDGYERAIEQEPAAGDWVRDGALLVAPSGQVVAQAEDGTIFTATDRDLAKAALPATEDYRDLWLSSSGDVSFSILRAALMRVAATRRGTLPEVAVLDRADRVTGFVKLGDHESKVSIELYPFADEPIETFGADVEILVRRLAVLAATEGAPMPAGRALVADLLTAAKVQTRGESVLITGKIGRERAEAAAAELGGELSARKDLGEARGLH